MAVNLNPPDPAQLAAVDGVELGFAEAGIRKRGGRDLMLMRLAPGSRVAGVFTQNGFAAAPVQVCRRRLAGAAADPRARHQRRQRELRDRRGGACAPRSAPARRWRASLGCTPDEVLPFSTGVILEPLPVERIEAALPRCLATLGGANWGERGRGHHDHRHRAEGRLACGRDRRPAGDRHRHRQGRRHAAAEHGHDARVPRDRRGDRAERARAASSARRPKRRSTG